MGVLSGSVVIQGSGLGLILLVVLVLLPIGGAIDAACRPTNAWVRAGQSRALWVTLQLVGILFFLGWLFTLVYAIGIRRKVVFASRELRSMSPRMRSSQLFPVGPAPGWYPDPDRAGGMRWWDGTRWTEHQG